MPDSLPKKPTSAFQPPTASDLGGEPSKTSSQSTPTLKATPLTPPVKPLTPSPSASKPLGPPEPLKPAGLSSTPPGKPTPPPEKLTVSLQKPGGKPDSKKAKIVGAVLGLLLLLVALPLAVYLVSQRQYIWPKAAYPGCEVSKEYSGATTPGYDCKKGSSASVTLTACLPEGCAATDVSYSKTEAYCDGEDWLDCEGACGSSPSTGSIHVGGGECKSASVSCSPRDGCGTCQVDIDSYGVRRWTDSGCEEEPPEYEATCEDCVIYDEEWREITTPLEDQTVYLATYGSSTHPEGRGRITKARFRVTVDGVPGSWEETTDQFDPGDGSVFYVEYTVPSVGSYTVESMVYDPDEGEWK